MGPSRCPGRQAGGYAERVEDLAEVPAALERALRIIQQERQAFLDMVSG